MQIQVWTGALCAALAALIGAFWQLASRHGVTTTLGPLELAVLRYGIPALVLLPVLRRLGLVPQQLARGRLALLVLGGGLPFGLVALAGLQWAPAAHMGVFMAGSVPLFTALGGWLAFGERVAGWRLAGLLVVVAGLSVFGVGAGAALAVTWRGDLLFILAAWLWAAYTLAFRASGLTPWQGTALVNVWSCLLLLPATAWFGVPRLVSAPWPDLAWQALGQGVLAGLLGLVTYLAAIARLGAARAALSAAVVPVLTAVGAAAWLHETLGVGTLAGAVLVMAGVALASGAFGGAKPLRASGALPTRV